MYYFVATKQNHTDVKNIGADISGIYLVVNKDDNKILYIGKSSDIKFRLENHNKNFDNVTYTVLRFKLKKDKNKEIPIKDYLLIIEECLIKTLNPVMNTHYNKTKKCEEYKYDCESKTYKEKEIKKLTISLNKNERKATVSINKEIIGSIFY